MKFKLFLLSTMVANAGFFTHDLQYYETHLDDAKEKMDECFKSLQHALIDKDEDKIKELEQDSECDHADRALKEAKSREEEARREIEEKQRKERQAKNKALFLQKKQEYILKYKDMPYLEFLKDAEKCQYYRHYGNIFTPKDSQCVAWKEMKKEKETIALDKLDATYPDKKLLDYKNKVCKRVQYGNIACNFAVLAFQHREESVIKNYLENRDLLKKDFNDCYAKITAFNKQRKFQEAQNVSNTYKCYMTYKAAQKLNIYGFFRPMK